MKERPILFSAPMVRALRENRKTVTRRTRGLDKINAEPDAWVLVGVTDRGHGDEWRFTGKDHSDSLYIRCPYGVAGDRLWTRESFGIAGSRLIDPCINYRADGSQRPINRNPNDCGIWLPFGGSINVWPETLVRIREGWIPSIHMPRWASRDTLEGISARPERLQGITEADAKAEGIVLLGNMKDGDGFGLSEGDRGLSETAREAFESLWESNSGKKLPWSKNPWAWRVEFRRLTA